MQPCWNWSCLQVLINFFSLSVFYIHVKLIVYCGNHQHASHHKHNHHLPMTYSGHRPDRTIKAEEKWRGKSRKTTKRLIFPADDRRNVSKILPQSGSCLRTDLVIEPSSSCLKQRRRKSAALSERRLKRGAFWTSYPFVSARICDRIVWMKYDYSLFTIRLRQILYFTEMISK